MQLLELKDDINIMAVQASSFPNGVFAAFDALKKKVPFDGKRIIFGISHGSANGDIIYKAAAEELKPGEASEYGLEHIAIKKGTYLTINIHNWMQHMSQIGTAFQQLLADPRLDRNSFCVEWYKGDDDVLCMVKLNMPDIKVN
jgi:predicted transcriptional regulator YdeE